MTRIPFVTDAQVKHALDDIVTHLRAGGLIAYPTETVYGFGSLVRDDALTSLALLKARDEAKPFLLLVREAADFNGLVWTPAARKLAETFWPGPLTLALRAAAPLSPRITSADGNVAIRATPHDALRALLDLLQEPITSTSANTPGDPPAAEVGEVERVLMELNRDDVWILDGGRLAPSLPSTVVDCSTEPPRVLRQGAITMETLSQVIDGITGNHV